jgi:hypothetical protein
MELRGSLGGSMRLFLQRDAVDSGEIGRERPHVSSTGAIVAPLVARQGLEIRVLHDPDTLARTSIFMKMMAHRQQRRTSLGVALDVEAHPQREHVVAGRLMSYGISIAGAYRSAATLAKFLVLADFVAKVVDGSREQ